MFVTAQSLALKDLEADHRLLDEVFSAAASVNLPCNSEQVCSVDGCTHQATCTQQIREHFHRTMFAVVGHFGREDRYLCSHLTSERYQQHARNHADLSAALQAAIVSFGIHRNVKRAFGDIAEVFRRIDHHHRTEDSEFLPSPRQHQDKIVLPFLTELPATGNPEVDAEHARLHAILRAVHALCENEIPACEFCSAEKQQQCADAAIDLLTDALKFMVEHFRHEEKGFRNLLESAVLSGHVTDHAAISRRMTQLIGDYEDNNTALVLFRLAETLRIWLHHHIVKFDLPLYQQSSSR